MRLKHILTSLLLCISVGAYASYTTMSGSRIYLNANQSFHDGQFNWANDNATLFLYIWNGSGSAWVTLTRENDNIWGGDMPAGAWEKFIVIRKPSGSTSGWGGTIWNRTCDIEFYNDPELGYHKPEQNCIYEFWSGGEGCTGDANYRTYTPTAEKIASVANAMTAENIEICPSAVGGPFSLRAKLNSTHTEYVYGNVNAHGWYYSSDGTTWTSVDSYAGQVREGEELIDLNKFTLPATGNTFYYYLHSNNPEGRRKIKVTTTATDCELNCEITSFQTANSNINADNNTFTVDGMVAFGAASGSLIIECDGVSTTIATPKSPQSFSLHGIAAYTAENPTATVTARFSGNNTCSQSLTITRVDAAEDVVVRNVSILTGDSYTLVPTGVVSSNDYVWEVDGETYTGTGTGHTFNTATRAADDPEADGGIYKSTITKTYFYKEYNPVHANTDDLMNNGSYEQTSTSSYGTVNGPSTISDYKFWNVLPNLTQYNYYDGLPEGQKDNGFAVVKDAYYFYPTFAHITARAGSYFALFDAAADGISGKRAWYSKPTQGIKEGTTYVFSFWAANINNFGEMDNAAKLQFKIKYKNPNGTYTEKLLGSELNLNDSKFRNNLWHQCSATFYAPVSSTDVEISVVNNNTNTLNVGNDFALDDIQFHAVSTVSRTVKSYQKFVVTFNEPAINTFTVTPRQHNCGATGYTVDIAVSFAYPKGNLIIKDTDSGTILLTKNVSGLTSTTGVINFTDLNTHNLKAYFADWDYSDRPATFKTAQAIPLTTPQITGFTYIDRQSDIVNCNSAVYTQSGAVKYINMNGKFTVSIDNNPALTKQYDIDANQTTEDTKNFAIDNVPADSLEHTAVVTFAGRGADCAEQITFRAPYSPVITNVEVTDNSHNFACGDNGEYHYKVLVYFNNAKASSDLTVQFHDGSTLTKKAASSPVEFVYSGNGPTDGAQHMVYAWFNYVHPATSQEAEADDCEFPRSFAAPHLPQLSLISSSYSEVGCNDITTTLTANLKYAYQQGTLTYWVDNLAHHTATYNAASDDMRDLQLTVSGIPADGRNDHVLYVEFSHANSCRKQFTLPAVPLSTHIESVQISGITSPVPCSATSYNATVTVNTTYDITGQSILLKRPDDTPVTMQGSSPEQGYAATGMQTVIPVTLYDINSGTGTIVAACVSTPQCTAQGTYSSPLLATITPNFAVAVSRTGCGEMNYTVSGTVYFDVADGDLIVEYDSEHRDVIQNPSGTSAQFTIQNMNAVTSPLLPANLQLTAYFSNSPQCSVPSGGFRSPTMPTLSVTPNTATAVCDNATYQQTFGIEYLNMVGPMQISVDGGAAQTVNIVQADLTTRTAQATLTLPADGQQHTVSVTVAENCQVIAQPFTAAQAPVISSVTASAAPVRLGCNENTYSISITVAATNYLGLNLVAEYTDGGTPHTVSKSASDVTTLVLENLTDINNGLHNVNVHFENFTCSHTASYTAPVKATAVFGNAVSVGTTNCGVMDYTVEGDVTYDAVDGDLIVYFDNTHKYQVTPAAGSTSQHYTIEHITTEGADLQLHAYFTGKPDCEAASAIFSSPAKPTLTATLTVDTVFVCNDKTYNVTVSVDAQHQTGTMSITDRNITTGRATTQSATTFSISRPAAREEHEITVAYNGPDDCSYIIPQHFFVSPDVPEILQFETVATEVDCGVTAYDQPFLLRAIGQQGAMTVLLDDNDVTSSVTDNGGGQFTLNGVDLQSASHTLRVHWAQDMCDETITFNTPTLPSLSVAANNATAVCDNATYQQTFNIQYRYQRGEMKLFVDGNEMRTLTYTERSAELLSINVSVPLDADGQQHTVSVTAGNGCQVLSEPFTAPQAPVINSVTASAAPARLGCDQTDYEVTLTVNTANYLGQNLMVEYTDGGQQHTESYNMTAVQKDITLTLSDINAGQRTVTVYFEGQTCRHTVNYTTPVKATINQGYTVNAGTTMCGVMDYAISGTVTFDAADGDLIIAYDDTHRYQITPAAGSTSQDFVIEHMSAEGDNLTLRAWFSGNGYQAVCDATSAAFASPSMPTLTATMAVDTAIVCEDKTYTAIVTIDAQHQTGSMTVIDRNITANTETAYNTNTFTLPLPSRREEHEVRVEYDGPTDCSYTIPERFFTSPAVPRIIDLKVMPLEMECGDDNYAISLRLTFSDQSGQLHIEDNGTTIYDGTADISPFELTTEKILAATGSAHDISVTFGICQKTFSAVYAEPVKPACAKTEAVICHGENYSDGLFNLVQPAVGYHEVALAVNNPSALTPENRLDSLFLTVKVEPSITIGEVSMFCNSEQQFTLPVTSIVGEPDNITAAILGEYTDIPVTMTDNELVVDKPEDIAVGDYILALSVGQEGLDCRTTTSVNIRIADGELMYSKWNGVLFIDNHYDRFIEYQWYRNGVAMEGETQQRLYNPEGLDGTYYCRMTTTERTESVGGIYVYTCEQAFADVKRSADEVAERMQIRVSPTRVRPLMPVHITVENADAQQIVTATIFDVTGKHVASHTIVGAVGSVPAPEQAGMYIIRVKAGDTAVTQKIIVQ